MISGRKHISAVRGFRSTEERLELCVETLNRLKGYFANGVSKDPRMQHWINLIKKALE